MGGNLDTLLLLSFSGSNHDSVYPIRHGGAYKQPEAAGKDCRTNQGANKKDKVM